MKVEIRDSRDNTKIFDVDAYEENNGVLTLYLSNGSIIQYGPYDWHSLKRIKD